MLCGSIIGLQDLSPGDAGLLWSIVDIALFILILPLEILLSLVLCCIPAPLFLLLDVYLFLCGMLPDFLKGYIVSRLVFRG
jgi:hypothetical protein